MNQLATVIAADETLSQTDRLRSAVALHIRTPTSETSGLLLNSILESPPGFSIDDHAMGGIIGTAPLHASGLVVLVEHEDGRPALFNTLVQ